jgi:hypothetical protein
VFAAYDVACNIRTAVTECGEMAMAYAKQAEAMPAFKADLASCTTR